MEHVLWRLAFAAVLIRIAEEDIRRRRIGKEECLLVLLLGILRRRRDPETLLRALLLACLVMAAGRLLYFLAGGRGLGAGDVRLCAAAAVCLGEGLLPGLLIGLLPALGTACRARARGVREIPLGLFLAAGILIIGLLPAA